ncbi:MAG: methionyl-tRNA formyltransferase [Spirochaetes bacterium]|uniref:methionyl-tRNA formyltransferase n=1 Tax=Candidatus Ornithospirochaeta stercoripullorum TaxID=2840899 RepID=A0A9D9E3M9_9SPIO|nr:methionyl-tRNA formyltransferase [Candidatus Ornithospirochaeta stercoripullorum]
MRIVFAATGEIALPLLDALSEKNLIALVLTAPDAPGKRGKGLVPSPVKVRALELGLEVYQPQTIKKEARNHIASYHADTLLSFCYGKIFGPLFLSIFKETFNVHPSLLPLHRGPSPVYQAIKDGDRKTGISLQKIGLGIDEGDVYDVLPIELDGTETEGTLSDKVAGLVPSLVLPVLLNEKRNVVPQSGEPTYTSFVTKEDGRIDFSAGVEKAHALIRASYPWPKAYALLDGAPLYLTGVYGSGFALEKREIAEPCGTIVALEKGKGLKIAFSDGYLHVTRVLPPMKKEMDASSFINGRKDVIGRVLS